MKPIVIFGTGDFSDIVTELVERDLKREVVGYVVDDDYYKIGTYNNKSVIPLSKLVNCYPPSSFTVVLGFIGNKMFTHRREKFNLLVKLGYSMENLIHPSAVISSKRIGVGNIILENCVIGYFSQIGDGNILWPLSSINHHNSIGSFNNFSPSVSTSGGVTIGDCCFLGNNSTYKNKVTVANYTLVGAGTYIYKDTEEYGVYVPKRFVKLDRKSTEFNI